MLRRQEATESLMKRQLTLCCFDDDMGCAMHGLRLSCGRVHGREVSERSLHFKLGCFSIRLQHYSTT
jgi:hypothetical protein